MHYAIICWEIDKVIEDCDPANSQNTSCCFPERLEYPQLLKNMNMSPEIRLEVEIPDSQYVNSHSCTYPRRVEYIAKAGLLFEGPCIDTEFAEET